MSFNPVRAANHGRRNKRPRRKLDPHAGTKHSDIVRRGDVSSPIPSGTREDAKGGYIVPGFTGEDFKFYYSCMYAGNNTGVGVNEEGDRCIRVLRGTLFVILEADGNRNFHRFNANSQFIAKRGTSYGLATPGDTDVELLIVESADYDKNYKLIDESGAVESDAPTTSTEQANKATVERTDPDRAKLAAEKVVRRRRTAQQRKTGRQGHKSFQDNANSSAAIGVNLRATPPTADDD